MSILKHHALCETSGSVIIRKAGKRLNSVEGVVFPLYNILQHQIDVDRPHIDHVCFGGGAEKLAQAALQRLKLSIGNALCSPDDFATSRWTSVPREASGCCRFTMLSPLPQAASSTELRLPC